jgi:hypothetical protein
VPGLDIAATSAENRRMAKPIPSRTHSSLVRLPALLAVAFAFVGASPRPAAAEGSKTSLQILSATIKDKVIEGAQVMFQKTGNSTVSATTDAGGKISIPRPFGGADDPSTTLLVKKDGYSTLVVKCPCDGLSYAISPVMKSLDGLRIVLNWGAEPRDIDSHLVFPGNHVYFSDKNGEDANLDVDDTNGYGPETITVEKRKPGVKYIYALHNFTDGDRTGSRGLSDIAGAKVFVYVGSSLVRTFTPPTGRVGNTWVAFAIGEDGEFYDINRFADVKGREKVRTSLVDIIKGNLVSEPVIASGGRDLAKSLNRQGEQAYHAGDVEGSTRLYQEAISADPEYGQAYSNLGLSYQKLGRPAEALWANRKAIALASGGTAPTVRASSYYNIARIYEDASKWAEALAAFERAKQNKPRPPYDEGIARMKAKLHTP